MNKKYFIDKIEKIGARNFRAIFKQSGLYGEPELWLYKVDSIGDVGVLVTRETLEDEDYLKEYLYDFTK